MTDSYQGSQGAQLGGESSSGGVVTEQVKHQTQATLQQAQDAAAQAADQARQQASSMLDSQRSRAAQSLSTMGSALRQTGQQLQEQNAGPIAQLPERAADEVEKVSGYLSSTSVEEIVADAENFARRNPAIFLGGAFTLGLLAARFLKSSSQAARANQQGLPRGYTPATTPYIYDPYRDLVTNDPGWPAVTSEGSYGP
jgi:hypothetical protein